MPVVNLDLTAINNNQPNDANPIRTALQALQTTVNGIDVANLAASLAALLPQPGDIKAAAFAGQSGWLLCDGAAVSRTTYAALFSAIGTTYGAGDTTTTFNVPDLRGRVPVGMGTLPGGSTRTLGATGGEENHVLTTPEIPGHTHGTGPAAAVGASGAPDTPAGTFRQGGTLASGQTASTGGGGGHNNMQPFAVVNFLIKV